MSTSGALFTDFILIDAQFLETYVMHVCSSPTADDMNEITLQLPHVFGNELIDTPPCTHSYITCIIIFLISVVTLSPNLSL